MKDRRVVGPVSPSRTVTKNTRHVYQCHAVVVMVTQVMVRGEGVQVDGVSRDSQQ